MSALVVLSGGVAGWLLTGWVRRYALARTVLDVPNQRSSHSVPTPRGGGLAIVATSLVGTALLGVLGSVSARFVLALLVGGTLVAGIGWIDDLVGVSARVRALVHFIAAGAAIAFVGGLPSVSLGWTELQLGPAGSVVAVVGVVWMINLYNFMDGIDGLAAGEAVTTGLFGGATLLLAGRPGLAATALLIGAASGGFLLWNWAPAKIFMGDVGSGFLGFVLAVLAVASERAGAVPLLVWLLLLGVFIFDATITLLRRIMGGERWYEGHRSHAYQRAVRAGFSHARVSGTVMAVNVALGLLALLAWRFPSWLLPGVALGAVCLAWLYARVERIHPMRPVVRRCGAG